MGVASPAWSHPEPAPPRVTLRNWFSKPFDSAVAAARTCYTPRLISPEEITDRQRWTVSAATFFSGHHTVYQHAHFEFGLEGVSRHFVWSFLHAHPFYNSEQQSQRFVRLEQPSVYVPPLPEPERALFWRAVERAWTFYRELARLLQPLTREILSEIWHAGPGAHPRRLQKVERLAEKRALETARYVLPVATHTAMVHTISGIVLHRLWRMVNASDVPDEAREVIGAMVDCVHQVDAQFFDRFGTQPLEEPLEWHLPREGSQAEAFAREFDERLGGRISKLLDSSQRPVETLADAYRAVLGLTRASCPDDVAVRTLLDPAINRYRLEVLDVGVHAPAMRALGQVHFTFAKKLSHSADSQNQRHRMIFGARPLLVFADRRQPDYILPRLIGEHPEARAVYQDAMAAAWEAKNELLARGVPLKHAVYLLPNATAVRLVESGSLLHFLHKWTLRTCFNAQEEIYEASVQEIEQIRERWPALAQHIGPPCFVRAGRTTPICTEGGHYCGIPVWQDWPNLSRPL